MFTGIIEGTGRCAGLIPVAGGARLTIEPAAPPAGLELGESIAVSGVCLTVEPGSTPTQLHFFLSGETLERTTLGALRPGARVNLERALRADGRLGGHLVMGHVDGVGAISRFDRHGEAWELEVSAPPELAPFLAVKGSIAVEGISLTIAAMAEGRFTVAVIPHTVRVTNLDAAAPGTRVNLEADMLARYVVRALEIYGGGAAGRLSREFLDQAGF